MKGGEEMVLIIFSLIILPVAGWLILFTHVGDQSDGTPAEEAQKIVFKRTIRHPIFWLWLIFTFIVIDLFNGGGNTIGAIKGATELIK